MSGVISVGLAQRLKLRREIVNSFVFLGGYEQQLPRKRVELMDTLLTIM